MLYDRSKLVNDMKMWLSDRDFLDSARRFLGGTGLSDSKVGNWKNREIPETLIEGAALYHCSQHGAFDAAAADMTGLVADENWQVFVISESPDSSGDHSCGVVRLWSGLRQHGQKAKERHMTHKTWFSGIKSKKRQIFDLISQKPHTDTIQLSMPDEKVHGSEWAISWDVGADDRMDVGYFVNLEGSISSKPTKKKSGQQIKHEYIGGLTNIPASTLYIVAAIPHSLMNESSDILDESKFDRPRCIRFLADGIPTNVIEDFLQQKRERRWLMPWFDNLGSGQRQNHSGFSLPKVIKDSLPNLSVKSSQDTHETFVFRIDSPAPYLYYAFVFQLKD